MVNRKRFSIILLVMILIVSFTGCTSQQTNTTNEKYGGLKNISLGASGVGSSSYNKLTVWSTKLGEKLGINITPEGTAGTTANTQLVGAGDITIGASTVNVVREGFEGLGFAEGKKLENLRLMATLDSFVLQFYTLERSGIKSIQDLEGKTVNLSNAGSGTDTWGRRIFEHFGINPKITNVSPNEANELMRDGAMDVCAVMGSVHPAIIEMNATESLVIFGLGASDANEFIKDWPDMYAVEMKAGTYEGQKEPFATVGEISVLVTNKNTPEDLIYDITKATYENKEEMAVGYPGFASISEEDITFGLSPLHKGAYKYYQEKGIQIPDALKPID